MADGKFGQFSVVMQGKGAVLALASDCETPHETLRAFWETVHPLPTAAGASRELVP